jgi:anhydro-N-acetylmuramic acid kinase
MQALAQAVGSACLLNSMASYGLDPSCIEAEAFAWLAKRRIEGRPRNLPSVTGAAKPLVLALFMPAVKWAARRRTKIRTHR